MVPPSDQLIGSSVLCNIATDRCGWQEKLAHKNKAAGRERVKKKGQTEKLGRVQLR
jgi:hypothetical protein